MPKQIKKEKLNQKEKINRIFAVASMSASILVWLFIIFLLPDMIKYESAPKTAAFSSVYLLFSVSCVTHCVTAYKFYKVTNNFTGIFHCIISLLCTLSCVFNLRFILVMLFSVFGKTQIARSLIGNKSMLEFLNSQTINWTFFAFSLIVMIIIGVLGIIRLISSKHN